MKKLSLYEKARMIGKIKKEFEKRLEREMSLTKVQSPLFIKTSSGLQDQLSGYEKAVTFTKESETFEIVHSLAKWKREALGRYGFPLYTGLFTDMKAIRKDEEIDEIHSIYVEQWDWEKVIDKSDRKIDYLKETVKIIYKIVRETYLSMKKKYDYLSLDLPKTIKFYTSQELEDMYPDKTPKERERIIVKKEKAVFIIGIGGKLKSGIIHDHRSPDYDDWSLDGDILVYDPYIDKEIELSSMGIRVDKDALLKQLELSKTMDRLELPYHQKIVKEEIPFTIGGGIGISRICMLILGVSHIALAQASSWDVDTLSKLDDLEVM